MPSGPWTDPDWRNPNESCPVYVLASYAGVSERHVRRLLARHKPPGFYRTRGGHWRCRGPLTHARRLRVLRCLELVLGKDRPERRRGVRLDISPPTPPEFRLPLATACEILARAAHTPVHLAAAQDFLYASQNLGPDEPSYAAPAEAVVSPALAGGAKRGLDVVRLRAAAFRLYWAGLPLSAANLAAAMGLSRASFFRRFPGRGNRTVADARSDVRKLSPKTSGGEIADLLAEETDSKARTARPRRTTEFEGER